MQFKPMLFKRRLYTNTYMYVHIQKFYKWITDFMHFRIFKYTGARLRKSYSLNTCITRLHNTRFLTLINSMTLYKVHSICLKAGHSFSPWAVSCWQGLMNTFISSLTFPHGLWRYTLLSHLRQPLKHMGSRKACGCALFHFWLSWKSTVHLHSLEDILQRSHF